VGVYVAVGTVVCVAVGVYVGVTVPVMFCGLQLERDTLNDVDPFGASIIAPSSGEIRSIICDCPGSRYVSRHVSVPRCHSMIKVTPVTAVTWQPSAQEPIYG